MAKCDFNKVAKQLYFNQISAWAFFFKFATYFQNTFGGLLVSVTSMYNRNLNINFGKLSSVETP